MKIINIGILASSLLISGVIRPSVAAEESATAGGNTVSTYASSVEGAVGVDVTPIEYVDTNDNDEPLRGYVSIPQSVLDGGDEPQQVPAVVILPGWSNVDDYVKTRATMISQEFNWIGFAADLYGENLHDISDFDKKVELSTQLRSDPELFNGRIQAAIDALKEHPNVDPTKISIIGYCLGGTGVMSYSFADTTTTLDGDNSTTAATTTTSDIVGAVSFHGGLLDFDVPGQMANPILILSGGDDDTGTAIEDLESKLVDANSTWQITRYSGIEHGFTMFDLPAYNAWVDERSWNEMGSFLSEVFDEMEYGTTPPSEGVDYYVTDSDSDVPIGVGTDDTSVAVETVMYDDNGFPLEGYLAMPMSMGDGDTYSVVDGKQYPAVVIVPNWDGVNGPNGYESERAVMMANQRSWSSQQYIGMVADIYGVNYTNVEEFDKKMELAGKYRSDPALFVGRIQAAVNVLIDNPSVDNSNIFVAGYCLGGTGALDYAFADTATTFDGVKAIVPVHGGLNPLRQIQTDDGTVEPYILVLSGGVDDSHGNTTELEMHLDSTNATWEVTRFSNGQHGFSEWGTGAYQKMADSRSWLSMMSLFDSLTTTDGDASSGGDNAAMDNDGGDTSSGDENAPMVNDDGNDDNDSSASSSFGISMIVATTAAVAVATVTVGLL